MADTDGKKEGFVYSIVANLKYTTAMGFVTQKKMKLLLTLSLKESRPTALILLSSSNATNGVKKIPVTSTPPL